MSVNTTTGEVNVSPAAKAKSARTPRTGGRKKDAEPDVEAVENNGEVEQETAREAARREKEEKAAEERAAAIESGALIVTDEYEFTLSDKQTQSAEVMSEILDAYRESDVPLVFNKTAKAAGAKYPEDLVIAMYVLEELDFVQKFTARPVDADGAGRSQVAFLWTGEDVE